jgi:hypothetical protein
MRPRAVLGRLAGLHHRALGRVAVIAREVEGAAGVELG